MEHTLDVVIAVLTLAALALLMRSVLLRFANATFETKTVVTDVAPSDSNVKDIVEQLLELLYSIDPLGRTEPYSRVTEVEMAYASARAILKSFDAIIYDGYRLEVFDQVRVRLLLVTELDIKWVALSLMEGRRRSVVQWLAHRLRISGVQNEIVESALRYPEYAEGGASSAS